MEKRIENVITALRKNNMQGIYVPCITDITKTVEDLLFKGAVITSGGSVSLKESGVWDLINSEKYCYVDRNKPCSSAEKTEIMKTQIGADFYFCSANAITENGELVNVDGNSNRVAAIAFGPKKVIVIAGANKIVKNVEEGFLRVKEIAAPKNTVRLGLDTPCSKLGKCVALTRCDNPAMTDGCESKNRICRNYLVTANQRESDRITVIICGESLGY